MEKITIYTKPKSGISGYKISAINCSANMTVTDTNVMNIVMQLCRLREIYGHNSNKQFAYTFALNFGG